MNAGRYKLEKNNQSDWFDKQFQIMIPKINGALNGTRYYITGKSKSLNVIKRTQYTRTIVYTGTVEKVFAFLYGMHEALYMAGPELPEDGAI